MTLNLPITAKDLRALPDDQVQELLEKLGPDKAEELKYTWPFWARPDQLEPSGKWKIWMPLAGRGWGKTRCGAEWVRHRVMSGDKRIACIAPTKGDVRRVMVEGESGLLNVCWKNDKTYKGQHIGRPIWQPTNNTMTWENGAKAEFFSAEDPERLRGPQFFSAWCDELAAWRNVQDVWDMLQFTLRLGRNPRILVTTTPKPIKLVRRIVDLGKEDPERYIVTTGTSYDNKDNIDLEALSSYEGTRLGRQELYAEILEGAAGALWSMELLDKAQVQQEEVPLLDEDKGFKTDNLNLQRIVVAIDPAITSNEESDMTGIVVAGIDVNGVGYVLEDATGNYKPAEWAQKAIDLFYEYKADRIVAERNQGGDMVKHTLQTEDSSVPLRLVHASRGKYARAEPVSALYEQGRVKHLPNLDDLERQMTTWEPLGKMGSPDRLDACVWALTDLMLGGVARPQLTLSYKNAKEAAA
jgi:phage terminase large subunit-like protein